MVHGAAKGNDHSREQKQIQGGLIGITRKLDLRDKHFLMVHILSKISKDLRETRQLPKIQLIRHCNLNNFEKTK